MSRHTRLLLVGGVVAAPLFIGAWALQAFTRAGFDPTYHPLSLLALGEGGWMQIANFIVTGLLLGGAAVGLRRALPPGRGSTWVAILVALMGVGLIVSGAFATDAGAGFPAGAPEGAPVMSWHGAVHEVGFVITQIAFVALAMLTAVRFGRAKQRGWMILAIVALILAVALPPLGAPEAMAIRLVASAAVELALVAALCIRELGLRTRAAAA